MISAIKNAQICLPHGTVRGIVVMNDGRIEQIIPGARNVHIPGGAVYDAEGAYLLPGFIDIHSDYIENEIQPRPTSVFSIDFAFRESEKKLINQGITTMYHSLSIYKGSYFGEKKIRSQPFVEKIAGWIAESGANGSLIHHKLHLRYEVDNVDGVAYVMELLRSRRVDLLSFMDHTPGQGQFRDLEAYVETIKGYGHVDEQTAIGILEKQVNSQKLDAMTILRLADIAAQHGIPLASHDDDSAEKLDVIDAWNVDICEFPISIDIARMARSRGYHVSVGAPNILLGGSHSGNLSAAEAILDGCADVLCSDYNPSTILHAIFHMHREYDIDLHHLVNLATRNAAMAVRIDGAYGSIEPGRMGDIIQVRLVRELPVIERVWVDGRLRSTIHYHHEASA